MFEKKISGSLFTLKSPLRDLITIFDGFRIPLSAKRSVPATNLLPEGISHFSPVLPGTTLATAFAIIML
ncbi:MAG: hypothetical protein QMB82_03710 [Bacteroidales bacterium]